MGVSGVAGCYYKCKKVLSEIENEVIFNEPENNDNNEMKDNFSGKEQKKDNNFLQNDIFSERTNYKRGKSHFYFVDKGNIYDKDKSIIQNKKSNKNKENNLISIRGNQRNINSKKKNKIIYNKETDDVFGEKNYIVSNKENNIISNKENNINLNKRNNNFPNEYNKIAFKNDVFINEKNNIVSNKESEFFSNKEKMLFQIKKII